MCSDRAAVGETIVIAAGADQGYAMGLTVALTSALRHLDPSRPAHVFVFDGGLGQAYRERCRACLVRARPDAEITFVDYDPARFAGVNAHRYSHAAFLRLLITEAVPDRYRRVLYLDSDLVVEGDIARLWALPDEGNAFWAAFDEGVRQTGAPDRLRFADVPVGTPYFNSGVMLVELPKWKSAQVSERALAVLAEHGDHCIWPDQDALNIVAKGSWSVLPPSWNTQVSGLQALSSLPEESGVPARITHFINRKPWRRNEHCLRQGVFHEALLASGWCSVGEYCRHYLWLQNLRMRQWVLGTSALRPLVDARRGWRQLSERRAARRAANARLHRS